MAARATYALKAAMDLNRGDMVKNLSEITNLILQGNFTEFERRSKQYEQRFLKDPLYESPLCKLYNSLDYTDSRLLEKLDDWVRKRPSYASHAARGVYKVNLGYHIRGGEYIRDTPPENIAEMKRLHTEAKKDLLAAINANKRLSPVYCSLIRIARASGGIVDSESILASAVRSIPETYYIRYEYLRSSEPRWGGSYRQMQEYADSLDNEALRNPRIWSLKGEIAAERGFTARLDKDYGQAIQYYTEALSYGDRLSFLKIRGYLYMIIGQDELALSDFTRSNEFGIYDKEIEGYIADLKNKLHR